MTCEDGDRASSLPALRWTFLGYLMAGPGDLDDARAAERGTTGSVGTSYAPVEARLKDGVILKALAFILVMPGQ